jgi:FMN phosphatase YigB (HAD superfamily)
MLNHNLPNEPERLEAAVLRAEEISNINNDHGAALMDLFEQMGWQAELQHELFNDVMTQFRPVLYDDAIPFLKALSVYPVRVYIISNNNRVPMFSRQFEIDTYFTRIITPKMLPDGLPKPRPNMWEYLSANEPDLTTENTVIVGDDPWSDGAFAEACRLPCWLLDRKQRYSRLKQFRHFQFVPDLLAIVKSYPQPPKPATLSG